MRKKEQQAYLRRPGHVTRLEIGLLETFSQARILHACMHQYAFQSLKITGTALRARRNFNALLFQRLLPFSPSRAVFRSVTQMSPASHSLEETTSIFSRMSRRLQRSFQNPEEVSYHRLAPEKIPNEASLFPSADIAPTPVTSQSERSNLPNIQDQGELPPYLRHTNGNISRATVYALRGLHDAYPTLRTTKSYNLLIGCAVRQGEYDDAGRLFQEMVEAGCIPNMHTWRLRVRLYMAEGYPELAYSCAINGIDPGRFREIVNPGPIPFSVWVEMLKPAGRRRMIKPRLKEFPPCLTRHQECKYVLLNEKHSNNSSRVKFFHLSGTSRTRTNELSRGDTVGYFRSQGRRSADRWLGFHPFPVAQPSCGQAPSQPFIFRTTIAKQ